jgi:hypothetical protein
MIWAALLYFAALGVLLCTFGSNSHVRGKGKKP